MEREDLEFQKNPDPSDPAVRPFGLEVRWPTAWTVKKHGRRSVRGEVLLTCLSLTVVYSSLDVTVLLYSYRTDITTMKKGLRQTGENW